MVQHTIIQKIKDTMHAYAPTAQTILYGSQARGDARQDSDVDLLILLGGDKLTLKDEEKITDPLYEIEVSTGISISPVVMLKKDWEHRSIKTPFYINVMNEGIRL